MALFKDTAKVITAVALVVAAVFVLLRQQDVNRRLAENLAIAEEQETVAVAFARQQTANLEAERIKTRQAEAALAKERQVSIHLLHNADSVAADAHQVLQDSASSSAALRASLTTTLASLDEVSAQFRAYIDRTDSLLYRVGVERDAAIVALAAEKDARLATDRARDALRAKTACKVWFVSCPTRTQSFVLGAIATGAVVIALR
jgi:hypothetical protein